MFFFHAALAWTQKQIESKNPYFTYLSLNAPHGPHIVPEKYKKRFLDLGFDEKTAGRYGMIENIDDNFGRLMAKLTEWDALDNTLIIFMTDNGMSMRPMVINGETIRPFNAGMRWGKNSPYEGGTHVPFFCYWKGVLQEGKDIDALTAHIDLYKTFADLAGAKLPGDMQPIDGSSFLSLLENRDATWEDRMLFTHCGRWDAGQIEEGKYNKYAVRTEEWRWSNGNQLYHIPTDPYEKKNVLVEHPNGNDWYDGADGRYEKVKKRNDALGILSLPSGKNLWDPSKNTHAEYIEIKAYGQIKELVQMLPELVILWFDGEGYITDDQAFQFYKSIYDLNPKVLVNRLLGFDFGDYLDAGDNVIPSASDELMKHWETCGTTNNSWGYKSYDQDWKTKQELIYYLVDIASKGGNYLLNIGPDGKGYVPKQSERGLLEMGNWLNINGEAIYWTTRWIVPNEGKEETLLVGTGHRAAKGFKREFSNQDFWFTSKEDKVYTISMVSPKGQVHIRSLGKVNEEIKAVQLLGNEVDLSWTQNDNGLNINFPNSQSTSLGYTLRVELMKE